VILILLILGLTAPVFSQGKDEEAHKYMVRGIAAIEMAKSEEDLVKAAAEFKKATEIDPDLAVAWNNLGSVQAKLGQYKGAIESYRKYLALLPQGDNATKISDEIIKLEYRLEQAESFKSMSGNWKAFGNNRYRIEAAKEKLNMTGRHSSPNAIDYCISGKCEDYRILWGVNISLNPSGGKWIGLWDIPGESFPTACSIPAHQAQVELSLNQADDQIHLKITRPKFKVVVKSDCPWCAWKCGGVSISATLIEESVLTRDAP
jgi:tetratricopeptide (TPR) repeat protein